MPPPPSPSLIPSLHKILTPPSPFILIQEWSRKAALSPVNYFRGRRNGFVPCCITSPMFLLIPPSWLCSSVLSSNANLRCKQLMSFKGLSNCNIWKGEGRRCSCTSTVGGHPSGWAYGASPALKFSNWTAVWSCIFARCQSKPTIKSTYSKQRVVTTETAQSTL